MAFPLVGDTFSLPVAEGSPVTFKVTTVNGSSFTAAPETAGTTISGYGVSLDQDIKVEYNANDNTLSLTGSGLYGAIRMNFTDAYTLGSGNDVLAKVQRAASSGAPTVEVGIQSLFGDTGSLLEDANITGTYTAAAQNGQPAQYDWAGNIKLDFTPEDKSHADDVTVSLSNLSFGTDTANQNKRFLQSATLTLTQGGGNALTLGGVSVKPTSLSVSYQDGRAAASNNQYNKTFSLTLAGDATWGAETESKDDDFVLGLNGSGTYSQIYTTASIVGNSSTSTATPQNPVRIKSGLTAFKANAAGTGSIDLGPLALAPKSASISFASDLDKNYSLWNVGGSLGLQVGFIPDATISLGGAVNQNDNPAFTALQTILANTDTTTYPTPGVWSLGSVSADLHGTNQEPLVDLGLVSVDGFKLELIKPAQGTGPDLSGLGFYKFVNNNATQQPSTPPATPAQDVGKTLKATVEGVKLNSGTLVSALSGTADTILDVLSPVRPLVDFFTQDVTIFDGVDQALKDPIVSFLESTPNNKYADGKVQAVEFVDAALAAKSMLSGQQPTSITPAVKAAENVFTVLDQVSNLAQQDANSISLGDFSFNYPLNKLKPTTQATPAASTGVTATPPADSTATTQSLAAFKPGGSIANQIAATPNPNPATSPFKSTSTVSFPILSDPIGYVTKYFTDGSADLFTVDLGLEFAQNFDVSVPIPAFPVVKVGVQGGVDASLQTSITSSLSAQALSSLAKDFSVTNLASAVLNGTGIDLAKTKAQFGANIGLSVGVDAYIASLNLVGGLQGRLTIQPVLKQGETALENQVLTIGASSASKPAFIQANARLIDLNLEIDQNLDNVIATGLSKDAAYAKNTWLLTIIVDPLTTLPAALGTKLTGGLDRIRLIEIDKDLLNATANTGFGKLSLSLKDLTNKDSSIFKAFKDALKEQLTYDYPSTTFSDDELGTILAAFSKASPQSIDYATIDASATGEGTPYKQRKDFLQRNQAFVILDGTASQAGTRAYKQEITYYPSAGTAVKTANFYLPSQQTLNSSAPEMTVAVNGKLTESFNSIAIDLLATNVNIAQASTVNIKVKDGTGAWQSIGVLTRASASNAPSLVSLASAMDEKGAELLLKTPKSGDLNQANYKLILNISNKNKSMSSSLAQELIRQAETGTLQLGFDVTSGSSQSLAISDPRVIQGGAVSVGLESSVTNSKLLTNALRNLKDNGSLNNDLLREFAIVGQPTDVLNPAEFAYSRNAFGGVPETFVELTGYGLNTTVPLNNTIYRYDSLAVVNAINRTTINDTLAQDVTVKTGTATRQTVDPVSGDTYLSYINQDGNLALARRAANSSNYQLVKLLSSAESAIFSYNKNAPDIVAFNGKVMAAGDSSQPSKLARYLVSNQATQGKPQYLLQIDTSVPKQGTSIGDVRIGLITERDASGATQSDQLTVALAYITDSSDAGNVIVQRNKNLQASNTADSAAVINLDLTKEFANWNNENAAYFGDSVVAVDFMEFGSHADLKAHLSSKNASTIFSLEGTKDNLKIWNAAPVDSRKYQYPLNIQGINPSSLSVVYAKQPGAADSVPAFINNWKGTPQDPANRQTPWSKADATIEKNLAIVVTGTVNGNANNSWTNTDLADSSETRYSGLNYNEFTHQGETSAVDVAYLYSPYADMLSANAAALRLGSYTTSTTSDVAKQNVQNAAGGLVWNWYPMLGKKDNIASNVMTNLNANSDGYLKYGVSTTVSLDSSLDGLAGSSVVKDLQDVAVNNYVNLPKDSFQILPRVDGSYALSGFTSGGKIVSVDQIPNYETGLITTKKVFNTPVGTEALTQAFFQGTAPFVNQGEWAPLGIVSAADGVYIGDLRDPVKYSRPQNNTNLAPSIFSESRQSIDVGQSIFTSDSDLTIVLEPGMQFSSQNGKYTLDMQLNGELILYENTTQGRIVLYNINDFLYEDGSKTVVAGYGHGLPDQRAVKGTKLGIKQAPYTKSNNNPNGRYLCLVVPTQDNGSDYRYVPLNPDNASADNLRAIYNYPGGQRDLNYEWRQNTWGVTVSNTDNSNDVFDRIVLDNNGNLIAFDTDSKDNNIGTTSSEVLFYLKNWRSSSYSSDSGNVTTLTNSAPFGFNGLVSDVVRENSSNFINSTLDASFWSNLLSSSSFAGKAGYDILSVSPDLNSSSKFIDKNSIRDVVLTGTGDFAGLLSKRDGTFSQLSDAITWGRGAPPANQLKSIKFITNVATESNGQLGAFIQSIWTKVTDINSADFQLLNAAIPVAGKTGYQDWLTSFKEKYSSLRALSVLPAVSSRSYFSVPTIELTPRTADVSSVYKTYAETVATDQPYLSIDTNFKLDAFVKVVASFAWWNQELFKATFPILDQTWSFKTGYGAGGPVYGSQQIFLDQDHDLVADSAEVSSINTDAAFNLDLAPLAESLRLSEESPRNTIWNGEGYVYSPPSEGIDFRAGLLIVAPTASDSVFDTATGLPNRKVYITVPDSEYLVANIWTSTKYSSVLNYHFLSTDATAAAKVDFHAESKTRYSTDPYFVTKLTPKALEGLLNRYVAGIPAAYATSAGDTFDAYNGMVAADKDVAAQAFEAFRFTSRLTFVLETVERLLNRLTLDKEHWGQVDSFQERSSLISSYQLISTLAMAVEGQLDAYYTEALKIAASGQSASLAAIEDKTFKLDLSNADHLHLLLRFACLTVPTLLGQSTSLFNDQGRLNLNDPELGTKLEAQAMGLSQVAKALAAITTAYDTQATTIFQQDPRLVTTLLAPVKRSVLQSGGVIDTILTALPTANPTADLGNVFQGLVAAASNNRAELHDTTRIASITEALENDFDSDGNPVQHTALRISLNHAAPPGGTVVPLTYTGSAVYGTDYKFEGNDQRPGYAFIPFGETSVLVPIIQPQASTEDWSVTIGIEDPSSSYAVSADINRVFVRYRASTGKISLYDNNVLVRLSDDPAEPHKLVSANPEDKTFDYDFYKDSRVVGIEAVDDTAAGLVAKTLQYYVSSLDSQISIYATTMPTTPPINGGQWLLINDDVMAVYEGDVGPTDIIQFFNSTTGHYGYVPAGEINHDHPYQGSSWQNQGVVFSLRQSNREIAEAIGTITPVASVGTSFQAYPERSGLATDILAKIEALGLSQAQINPNGLRVRPQFADHQGGRASVVMDLASVADRLWQPGSGIASKFVAMLNVQRNGDVKPFSDAKARGGARVYSLHSSNDSLDTVVFDYVDGSNDTDQTKNSVDVTTAAAFVQEFVPTLQPMDGVLQFIDGARGGAPVIGSLQFNLQGRGAVVQDLRYAVLEPTESLKDFSPAQLLERSNVLISSLEKDDVTPLPTGADYGQSISLTNGQKLVLLERGGRDPASPVQIIGLPTGLTAGSSQTLTTPGGLRLNLEISTEVNKLPEFLSRDQQSAPVLNFTGLDGQTVRFDVEVAREADWNSTLGLYRVLDPQGAVRDALTGDVVAPGDPRYAKVALDRANQPDLRSFSVGDGRTNIFSGLALSEPGYLAPYAIVNGGPLFAYGAANPGGRGAFKVLSQNVFGYEDTVGTTNALVDYDDMLIAVRNPTLVA